MKYSDEQKKAMQHKGDMWLRHRLNDPLLFVLIVPLVILDVFIELYHQIGFRLCGIPRVKRSEYVRIDRHKLKYLNFRHKIACAYCGYANGFLHYASEIAARTEKYWCTIRHQGSENYKQPKYHDEFMEYGDKDNYRKKYPRF